MKLVITTMAGTTKTMEFPNKQTVKDFIQMYQERLGSNQRVKVTCDLLGIDGYIQGKSN